MRVCTLTWCHHLRVWFSMQRRPRVSNVGIAPIQTSSWLAVCVYIWHGAIAHKPCSCFNVARMPRHGSHTKINSIRVTLRCARVLRHGAATRRRGFQCSANLMRQDLAPRQGIQHQGGTAMRACTLTWRHHSRVRFSLQRRSRVRNFAIMSKCPTST